MKMLLLAGLLILLCAGSAVAQRRKPQPAPKPAPTPVVRVDLTADHLPPRLAGMGLVAQAEAYKERNKKAEKKEFETTEEQQRRAEQLDAELMKRFGSFRQNYFAIQPEITYDADNEQFELRHTVDRARITHTDVRRKAGEYVGENAFGVKRNILGYVNVKYYLIVDNIEQLPLVKPGTSEKPRMGDREDFSTELLLKFPVPRAEAEAAKSKMLLLLVGDVLDPLIEHRADEKTPTISEPTHEHFDHTGVYFELTELILYDHPTGRIWHRWKPTPPPPLPTQTPTASKALSAPPTAKIPSKEPEPPKALPADPTPGGYPVMGMGGVGRMQITYKEKARYTEQARKAGIQGTVVVRALFGADGSVSDITIVRGLSHGLNDKAIEAAQKVRFKPAEKDGKPVSAYGQLGFTFNLY